MIDQNPEPQELYTKLATGFRLSRAVWLAARFRLADVIGAGPAPVAEIARTSRTDLDSVKRLLDALVAAGLFRSEGDGRYCPTPASDLLRSDHPRSQHRLMRWCSAVSTLRPGEP